jgi:hypothetical protein
MLRLPHKPDISFLTPTHKFQQREGALAQCVRSVRNQKALLWEHLICTQHYHEKTEKFVESYQDPRIKYVFTDKKGKSGNNQRRYMIQEASGHWLHFLDDDNIIYKEFSNVLSKELNNTQKKLVIIRILHSYFRMQPFPKDRTWGRPKTLRYNGVDALNIVVRGDVAKMVGWRDVGKIGGDGDFAKRVVGKIGGDNVKYVKQVLAEHRNIYGKHGRKKNHNSGGNQRIFNNKPTHHKKSPPLL